ALIEAVKRLATGDRQRVFQQRGAKLAEASRTTRERMRQAATYAWDANPVSTARVAAELWAMIKNEDWSLVSNYYSEAGIWPRRLWDFNKPYQWPGHAGGGGIGYGAPSSVGAALANKKYGRFSVSLQTDGDLMYAPGVLWTAAHHRIPLLSVMLNNRGYHQEIMHVQRMCNERNRGVDRGTMGSTLTDSHIDFAKIAPGMGLPAEGPIAESTELGPQPHAGISKLHYLYSSAARGDAAILCQGHPGKRRGGYLCISGFTPAGSRCRKHSASEAGPLKTQLASSLRHRHDFQQVTVRVLEIDGETAPALAGHLERGFQTVAGGLVGEDVPRFFGNDTAGLKRR